ncbi:NACHT, LRR and PYD domains-containing protein 12 isoform X2 [Triplophysa dalaica]|uniref:NACHT, LRR and PYD domains-containing protein 12 isoform X2 n=1 Tax=Triplophysa dalaica TaxID=1582913 RepID=UPI0024DF7C92|nr:NACHT, LRR and PYD domains-containing protein 12 isoform X2 [Triplophysa dalaica]
MDEATPFNTRVCQKEADDVSCETNLFGEREDDAVSKMSLNREKEEDVDLHYQIQRPESPVLSLVSMKSDRSMAEPLKFSDTGEPFHPIISESVKEGFVHQQFRRAPSPQPSCLSLKSDRSMAEPLKFSYTTELFHPSNLEREKDSPPSPQPSCLSLKSDRSMAEPLKFSDTLEAFHHRAALCQFQAASSPQPSCVSFKSDRSMAEPLKFSVKAEPFLPIMEQETEELQQNSYKPADDILQRVKENHKTSMKKKYETLREGINIHENKTLLNRIYTQLYIVEGEIEGANEEHEVVQIAKAKTERLQGTPINCNDIFQPISEPSCEGKHRKIKTVITKGIAGIGKTVSVQKFILDWAEGESNQDLDFLFALPFRELNLVKDVQYSLHSLLLDFHPELRGLDSKIYDLCILFIFDGLDESRITLNFSDSEKVSNASVTSSMSTLMSNLIQGKLLPSARIWITSRPAAANQIPPSYISRETEVQGFDDPQKEEYFRKKITDQQQASRIISHIRETRSLHIMCHIPVFCWITATVLQYILQHDHCAEIPRTLTEMYIHFLIIQFSMKRQKYDESDLRNGEDPKWLLQSNSGLILKLAELAFKSLIKGNIIFYEEDLRDSGIDVKEASVYSGICNEIFRVESMIYQATVYCFVHLSFQEFFAALYVFSSYLCRNLEVLKMFQKKKGRAKIRFQPEGDIALDMFLKGVMEEALKSQNGHLDLFLRFLHGISLESNQKLLQGVLTCEVDDPESYKKVIKNLRLSLNLNQKQNVSPERWINLSHCLLEMKDNSILEEIQASFKSEARVKYLSPSHCSALAEMILMSEDVLDELSLKTYNTTSMEAQRRLIPAVRNCRRALLAGFNLTDKSYETVASALQSENSPLRELDMSNNEILDFGMKLLAVGLKSQHCKLEILRLKCCQLNLQSCESLSSALLTAHTCVREIDMSNNELQDSGVKLLAAGLKNPHCKLETLRLSGCKLSNESCDTVATVVQSSNSMREIDMSNNDLQDSGLKLLADGLNNSQSKLEILRLGSCNLTYESCETLASILQTANCHLKDLDISNNDIQDSGVMLLSAGLKSPHCKLKILRMSICNLTHRSCESVASVLQSKDSVLRELNLNKNDLQDSGIELLSKGLQSSNCKLEILRLYGCFLTEKGCSFLASALMSNPSHLRDLNLSCNDTGESVGRLLFERKEDPTCKLETLKVEYEGHFRIAAGFRRYACKLTMDPITAHKHLVLSEEDTHVTHAEEEQSYPDHPERFEFFPQVLCRESLPTCCSWEIEWSGRSKVCVSVSYKAIRRKGKSKECEFGHNEQSWMLLCAENSFEAWHDNKRIKIRPPSSSFRSKIVGVYLDWTAGALSFYSMSDMHRLTHLHTFYSTFTEPLYAGFCLYSGSLVALQSVLD